MIKSFKKFNVILLLTFLILFYPSSTDSYQLRAPDSNGEKIDVIIIDAGHGGKDPGTTGVSGVHEKNISLAIAKKLKALIEDKYSDIEIIMTRDTDIFIDLEERGRIANDNKGKLFLSIHCNAGENEHNDKSGFEIYLLNNSRTEEAINITMNENLKINSLGQVSVFNNNFIISSIVQTAYLRNSERFAGILQTELTKGTRLESRGIYAGGFHVLAGASMPSVLIECGYLSNQRDEIYLKSEKGQSEIANSIYKSIRFFKFDYDYENATIK
jgi:N-acetylmuramoyl-L-alanine amidase